MSKYCPLVKRKVVYLDCLECVEKICKKSSEKDKNTTVILNNDDKKDKNISNL